MRGTKEGGKGGKGREGRREGRGTKHLARVPKDGVHCGRGAEHELDGGEEAEQSHVRLQTRKGVVVNLELPHEHAARGIHNILDGILHGGGQGGLSKDPEDGVRACWSEAAVI